MPAAKLGCTEAGDTSFLLIAPQQELAPGLFRPVGAPGWAATAPGAGRPAHHHQFLGPSRDGVWGLCLRCRLSYASGLPHWCFPGNGGQHWGQAWGARARTPHIFSFGV